MVAFLFQKPIIIDRFYKTISLIRGKRSSMFYTKKIINLSLLFTGVAGINLEISASSPKGAWTRVSDSKVKTPGTQIFPTSEALITVCRSVYERTGTLNKELLASVRAQTKNPDMDTAAAIKFILSIHPDSPELRSPSRTSGITIPSPRELGAMSPFTLSDSISPEPDAKK